MMEFSQVVQSRLSVRKFQADPVPEDTLRHLFNALLCAPSAGNLQAYEIIVLRNPELKAQIGRATTACYEQICVAPLSLIFVANAFRSGLKYGDRGIHLFCIQDATVAATYAMLAATDLGLGTLWVGGFDNSKVSSLLKLKNGLWPVVIMPVGYSNETPERRSRRTVQDVIHELD